MKKLEVEIDLPNEGATERVTVSQVAANRYRIDCAPLSDCLSFGDVIEADTVGPGKLVFRAVVERSRWTAYSWVLARELIESPAMTDYLARITELGGHWDILFGGLLHIFLPAEVDHDPKREIQRLLEAGKTGPPRASDTVDRSRAPDFLQQEDTWECGPVLQVDVRLARAGLQSLSVRQAQAILEVLGIDGPYGSVQDVGNAKARLNDWREHEVSVGQWRLGVTSVGVKIIPALRRGGVEDFLLAVPPRHIEHAFGTYPWNLHTQWVTRDVALLHRTLITRFRQLHARLQLKAVLVQDEAWTCSLTQSMCGIYIAKQVGRGLGFDAGPHDMLCTVPLAGSQGSKDTCEDPRVGDGTE